MVVVKMRAHDEGENDSRHSAKEERIEVNIQEGDGVREWNECDNEGK